jgi:hypothetical protein
MMATATATSTSTPSASVVIGPYPNPSTGGPVTWLFSQAGTHEVRWSVVTTAYRNVIAGTFTFTDSGTFVWDLKDKSGRVVANGLYYVDFVVDGARTRTRVLVMR